MRISDWSAYVCSSDLTGPRCLVHGDSHQGNSYVRPNGERVWLDWQLVRKGRPWRDVTYFMLGALTIDERRSAARDLLRHYRECLAATGVTGIISDEDIWEQFRRRSEEHTSELQSLMRISYAVFCLKKKKKKNRQYSARIINQQ